MKSFLKKYWALAIPLVVIIVALFFFIRSFTGDKEEDTVIGMVDVTSIDVAAEFPGRLDSLMVAQGDKVKKGQLLGILRSNEIDAVSQQTLAGISVAQAQLQLIRKGPRSELVQATDKLYQIAEDQYELFSKTYQRMERLYNAEVISGQEKDIFYFKYQAAKKEMETAKLNLDMLRNGASPEVIQSAEAILKQAEEAHNLTRSLQENTRIYAPATGTISSLVIHEGEIVSIGYPIMTIEKENSQVIRFNIRQDKAARLNPGKTVMVTVPGCVPETFSAVVSSVAPSLEFANWVPTKDRGQFELRTFTIEVKPGNLATVSGLRSGMTASLSLSK
jgi:HlyD family secretion protein